jgi:hypothetical protein
VRRSASKLESQPVEIDIVARLKGPLSQPMLFAVVLRAKAYAPPVGWL